MPPKAVRGGLRNVSSSAFDWNRERRIGVAPESIGRFKTKVREMWRANRSRTSNQLRDEWKRYVQGWWGYFRLAEARRPYSICRAGFDGTYGNVSGCDGIMPPAGNARYDGWDNETEC